MKAVTLATLGMAALAATAQAATVGISPVLPCYLTGDTHTLSGTGYTPGGSVNIAVDGAVVFPVLADASGNFTTSLRFGSMRAVKTHTLTATDATNPALTASTSFVGTTHQVATKNSRGPAGKKFKLRGYGFLFGPKAYMHVRGHGVKRDVFLARPKGPCGTFTVKKRIVRPNAPLGKYRVQFDAKKKYSKKTRPRLLYQLTVFPRAGSSSAFAGAALSTGWTKVAG